MRLAYLGTGDIGLPTLRALATRHEIAAVITQPDHPAGRGLALREPAIKRLAHELGLVVLQPERLRRPEAVGSVRALEVDALVVFAYGQILPQSVLDLPRLAALNIHASLLPRWRGAAPIQAAIRAGDSHTGHTVMFMAAGLDTGDILLQREIPIGADETGGSLHDRLAALAPECILKALELLDRGIAPRQAQDNTLATLAPKLEREAGLLDWNLSAGELARVVRAYDPWPGAYTALPDGRKLKVFRTMAGARSGTPGIVLSADSEGIIVACGEGALGLREIQVEGRKRLPAAEYLRGHSLLAGTKLG